MTMTMKSTQRGATLLVGMIMLVLFTLLAISAFRTSTAYFRVVGNMQHQSEAIAAAQSALNQVLSKGTYFITPATSPTSIDVDINGDTVTDYTVAIVPPCLLSTVAIKVTELNPKLADDLKCLGSAVGKNTGLLSVQAGGTLSECSRVQWRVVASVTDANTGANARLTEGVAVRMDRTVADAYKADASRRCNP